MATAAQILGVQNTPVDLAPNPQATSTIPLQDSGQTIDVNTPAPSTVQPGADPATAMIQPQPMDAYQDPEIRMAAAHHNWLANIMDKATDILAGDTSVHVTRDAQTGNVTVTHDPATSGEKWGRIASAVLGGALKGYAAGQGPGGQARALATGFQTGQDVPQQQLAQANAEAANLSQQQLRAAQNALLNQQIVQGAWSNAHMTTEWNQKQADYMLDFTKRLNEMGAKPEFTNVKDMKQLSTYGISNPLAVEAHLGKDGNMLVTMPDGNGGVSGWTIPADTANQKYTKDWDTTALAIDPKDPTNTIENPIHVGANSTTNKDHLTREMALWVSNNKVLEQVAKARTDQTTANAAQTRANTAATEAGQKAPLIQAQTGEAEARGEEARANAARTRAGMQPPNAGTPAAAGTFDPAFPPPQNFPPGTEGIAPMPRSGGYKVPAQVSNRASLGRNIGENTDVAARIIQTQGDQLLGPVLGHVTSVEQMIGSDNPAISELGTRIHNIAMASVGIHGSRAVGNVHDQETNLLNHFRAGKDAALAALAANKDSAQTFINEERNYQTYGTSTGPNRQAARSGAPTTTGGTTGGGTAAPAPAAATNQVPPISKVPPGHDTTFGNGQVWRNVNGTAVRVK
jgi:hypothetical protein